MLRRKFVGVLVSCLSVSVAQAQHPLVTQRLTELNAATPPPSQQIVSDQIAKTADSLYAAKRGCAKAGLTLERILPATAERYVFSGAVSRQIRNGWTVIARHPGCDESPVRYMIVQDAGGVLRTTRVNRGLSYAHDSLIADTFPLAGLAAEAFLSRSKIACREPNKAKLGVTRIEGAASDLGPDVMGVRYKGSWTEIWPMSVCGEMLEVSVLFTPDGDGGAYTNIKGDLIKRLPAPANSAASK